jgi:RNA polymerase sigma-70 factor (ECF subfamily)
VGVELSEIEALYRRGQPQYFRVAVGLLNGDRDRAHDAVQESFARAIRARDGFRGEGTVDAWVWRTLTNVCLREGRRRPRPHIGDAEQVVGDAADAAVLAEWDDLRDAVARLPERQRLMLFLRHYADLDYERIAEIAGVERGTVAATLSVAHAALRREMTERVND